MLGQLRVRQGKQVLEALGRKSLDAKAHGSHLLKLVTPSHYQPMWRVHGLLRPVSCVSRAQTCKTIGAPRSPHCHATVITVLRGTRKSQVRVQPRSRGVTTLALIDGRIAELRRLLAAAAGEERAAVGEREE